MKDRLKRLAEAVAFRTREPIDYIRYIAYTRLLKLGLDVLIGASLTVLVYVALDRVFGIGTGPLVIIPLALAAIFVYNRARLFLTR